MLVSWRFQETNDHPTLCGNTHIVQDCECLHDKSGHCPASVRGWENAPRWPCLLSVPNSQPKRKCRSISVPGVIMRYRQETKSGQKRLKSVLWFAQRGEKSNLQCTELCRPWTSSLTPRRPGEHGVKGAVRTPRMLTGAWVLQSAFGSSAV